MPPLIQGYPNFVRVIAGATRRRAAGNSVTKKAHSREWAEIFGDFVSAILNLFRESLQSGAEDLDVHFCASGCSAGLRQSHFSLHEFAFQLR